MKEATVISLHSNGGNGSRGYMSSCHYIIHQAVVGETYKLRAPTAMIIDQVNVGTKPVGAGNITLSKHSDFSRQLDILHTATLVSGGLRDSGLAIEYHTHEPFLYVQVSAPMQNLEIEILGGLI